jgi:chromatin remodeling complex protein RSC6
MAKKRAKAKTTKRKTKKKAGGKRKSGLTQMTYTLSPVLAEICGSKKLTRPQVVKKLWAYIKAHKCQDTKNRRMINPDKKLCEVLGSRPIDMLKMAGCLSKHIKK